MTRGLVRHSDWLARVISPTVPAAEELQGMGLLARDGTLTPCVPFASLDVAFERTMIAVILYLRAPWADARPQLRVSRRWTCAPVLFDEVKIVKVVAVFTLLEFERPIVFHGGLCVVVGVV